RAPHTMGCMVSCGDRFTADGSCPFRAVTALPLPFYVRSQPVDSGPRAREVTGEIAYESSRGDSPRCFESLLRRPDCRDWGDRHRVILDLAAHQQLSPSRD